MEWQPIETAPKDGTPVIGSLVKGGKVLGAFDIVRRGSKWQTIQGVSFNDATHWMPLPDPPKEDS